MGSMSIDRRSFLKVPAAVAGGSYLVACSVPGGGAKASGETLRAAYTLPIPSLDPYEAGFTVHEPALMARRLIFDTLLQRDGDDLKGRLAKSWTQRNETSWDFHLRDDVTFHDGTPLTARDVKESLDYMRSQETEQTPLWEPVETVEVTGDYTLTINTKRPFGTLPVNLTLMFVTPAGKAADKDFFRKPVGSGPYTVKSFTPSAELDLSRAKDFWGTQARTPEIELPYISDTAAATTSLLNNELQILWPVPPDQIPEVSREDGIQLKQVPSWGFFAIWFNCSRVPFKDARVRRALWHAVDVGGIIDDLYGNAAKQMTAPIPETVFGYAEQQPYEYDPGKAKTLLQQAGFGGGFSASMMWYDDTGPLARQLSQACISAWSEVGVKVKPQSIQQAEWVARLNELDWDLELQTHTVSTGDADYNLGRLYVSSANRMGYKNPTLDAELLRASQAADPDERQSHYAKACEIIWNDAVGIYIANLVTTYALRDSVNGFKPVSNNQPDLSTVSLSG